MTTDEIVYLMIGSMAIITCSMMFIILYISRLEINNSRRQLNLDLIIHYSHRFHKMTQVFEKYQIRSSHDALKLSLHSEEIRKTILDLSSEISKNCAHNEFKFIKSASLRESMVLKSKELIEVYQEWIEHIKIIEAYKRTMDESNEDHLFHIRSLWDTYLFKYDLMINIIMALQNYLTNDSVEDILSIKQKLS